MATATEIKSFINKLGSLAVAEANRRIASGVGFVLPSVCIAQSALETGWGTSSLMVKANAFFGIKAGGSWTGAVYRADTWEVENGTAYNTTANFRAYSSLAESVKDYYDLIGNASRYENALSFGTDKSKWKTPRACITAIWAGGYATDTLYVEKIMSTINARDLALWDDKVTGEGELPLIYSSITLKKKNFVQGSLVVTDSGRSIQNDRSVKTAVAMEWDKRFTFNQNMDIKGVPKGYKLYGAYIIGDIASIGTYVDGNFNLSVGAGEKAFYLEKDNKSEFTPDDLPNDLNIEFYTGTEISTGEAKYPETIAFFVEVK